MKAGFGRIALALGLIAAGVDASGQAYKTVDPSGRITYSDRPPAGDRPTSIPGRTVDAAMIADLQGEWTIANVTFEGRARVDDKLVGATWSFRASELAVQTRDGKRLRFTVRPESGAQPKAFTFAPVPPSSERGGHMIYERAGDRLRLAYLDGIEGKATGFELARKLVVINLVARPAAVGPGYASPGPGRDACSILRTAGADALLGSTQTLVTPSPSNPSAICRIEGTFGVAVVLALVPGSSQVALERERAKEARDQQRAIVADEPTLGASAFSATLGNSMLLMALKGETQVILRFNFPPGHRDRLIPFAQRVLATL
ncbi:MAG: TIGR03067 domain-containing protein [Betaproteobacteria bacterium]